MKIFIKYILKSMLEKKGRMVLLVGSIAISISLLVGTLSASKTLSDMLYEQMHGIYDDFNIQISTRGESEKFIFNGTCLNDIQYKKVFKSIMLNGEYGDKIINYVGTTADDLKRLENITVLESLNENLLKGNGVLISKNTSDLLQLELGDEIKINLLGEEINFSINAICSDTGLFSYDTRDNFTVFASYEKSLEICNIEDGMYSNMLLAVDTDDIDTWISNFNEKNVDDDISAFLTVDENSVNGQLDWLQLTLYFMLAIIVVMTIFIISSTFKLIITERLPIIGTFLSQGSSVFKVISLLLLESCFYGILGGMLGCLGGIGVTKIITNYANPLAEYGIGVHMTLNGASFIISFAFALLMSMISAYLPIMGIRRLQIKDIILNGTAFDVKKSSKKIYVGIGCICVCAIIVFIDKRIDYMGSIPSLVFFFVGIMCLIPTGIELILGLIGKWIKNVRPVAMLAINNVRSSILLKSTTNLITVCIIAIIMMISLGNSIKSAINMAYSHMYYDVNISMQSKNYEEVESVIDDLKTEGKIDNIISIANINTLLNGEASKQIDIYCVDTDAYLDFEDYMYYEDKVQQLKELGDNLEGIIISKMTADNYGIEIGDTVQLEKDNKKAEFKVLSIVDARMFANGNYNIITKEAAKKYFGVSYASDYYLVGNHDDENLLSNLKKKLKGLGTTIFTKEELIIKQEDEISQLTDILNFITVLTILIGSISCMSNISINFFQRKKEIAVMKSIGLTPNKGVAMLVIENVIQAILACLFAFVSSLVINQLFVGIYIFLGMDLQFLFPTQYVAAITFGTLGIVLVLSISTVVKSKKINIIEEIRYE